MGISFIVAVGKNLEIGKDGALLWHLPEDLKNFKRLTQGHTIIMGRKTYSSIGRALPNRRNIVITRDPSFSPEGIHIAHSPAEALALARDYGETEIFIIGGAEIYRELLPLCDKLYLSQLDGSYPEADTYFPAEYRMISWKEVERREYHGWQFQILEPVYKALEAV